jgi:hypothetical protein
MMKEVYRFSPLAHFGGLFFVNKSGLENLSEVNPFFNRKNHLFLPDLALS